VGAALGVVAVPVGNQRGGRFVVPQPVQGLLGTAPMIDVTLSTGQTLRVTVDYDTGIR